MKVPCFLVLLSALASLTLSACGLPGAKKIYCPSPEKYSLKKDQADSYMPPLTPNVTYDLSVDSAFSTGPSGQQEAIAAAAKVWNDFSRTHRGYKFFNVVSADVTDEVVPKKKESCDFVAPGSSRFNVVRVDSDDTWNSLSLGSKIPAVTLRCYSGSDVEKQVVLINPKHTDSRQFMTIALHELGHSVGLDHSCDQDAGSATYASCRTLGSLHSYFQAVMYPVFRVGAEDEEGTTDIKQSLRENDVNRADCLYGEEQAEATP